MVAELADPATTAHAGLYRLTQIFPPGNKPPMVSEGTYLNNPEPLDASGKPVAFKDF
ncbi:MAG TPA: hypothetical protein VI365_26000 [Trebonia sp.]